MISTDLSIEHSSIHPGAKADVEIFQTNRNLLVEQLKTC